jgi:Uma2 family endonuclease
MPTGSKSDRRDQPREPLPPLENGDHLDQKTFHARYEAMPEDVRAELIGGIVYMASPQKRPHGRYHGLLNRWLDEYEEATPGTEAQIGATNILGPESEPQPDSCLFILPECGGQVWEDEDGYLNGAPDLMAEIASASESIDLHAKKDDYEKAGVREYVVVALRRREVFWFIRRRGKFRELAPGADGIFRSEVFPGLWLDPAALLRRDRRRLLAVLRQGLGTPEHAAFVARLARK